MQLRGLNLIRLKWSFAFDLGRCGNRRLPRKPRPPPPVEFKPDSECRAMLRLSLGIWPNFREFDTSIKQQRQYEGSDLSPDCSIFCLPSCIESLASANFRVFRPNMTDNSSEEDVDSLFVIFNNYKVAWIAELILRNYMEHCPPRSRSLGNIIDKLFATDLVSLQQLQSL